MFDVCKYFDKFANCFKTSDAKSNPKIKLHWLIDNNNDDACDAVLELQIFVVWICSSVVNIGFSNWINISIAFDLSVHLVSLNFDNLKWEEI